MARGLGRARVQPRETVWEESRQRGMEDKTRMRGVVMSDQDYRAPLSILGSGPTVRHRGDLADHVPGGACRQHSPPEPLPPAAHVVPQR